MSDKKILNLREAGRSGLPNRNLREMADELKCEPGQFALIRLKIDQQKCLSWLEDLARDRTPADFLGREDLQALREEIMEEFRDLEARELRMLPYFNAQLKSVESNVNVSGELSLLELLTQRNERSAK